MIGIIFVRLLAFVFRSVFVAITLPHFLIKTAFMWFFFFEKPTKTYTEWLKDALRHVRSDAYPTQCIPKIKFSEIGSGKSFIYIDSENESDRVVIKETPFLWSSIAILPFFFISSMHLMIMDDMMKFGKVFYNLNLLFMYIGLVVISIWTAILSFKKFCKRVSEESQQ